MHWVSRFLPILVCMRAWLENSYESTVLHQYSAPFLALFRSYATITGTWATISRKHESLNRPCSTIIREDQANYTYHLIGSPKCGSNRLEIRHTTYIHAQQQKHGSASTILDVSALPHRVTMKADRHGVVTVADLDCGEVDHC